MLRIHLCMNRRAAEASRSGARLESADLSSTYLRARHSHIIYSYATTATAPGPNEKTTLLYGK
jgi:hypothetical protein